VPNTARATHSPPSTTTSQSRAVNRAFVAASGRSAAFTALAARWTGTSEETRRRRADPRARRDGAGAGPRQAYAQRGDPMAGRKRQAGVRGRCAESRVRRARRSSATSEPILGLATYGYSRSRIIPIARPILCSPAICWSALRHAPSSHTSIAARSTRTVVYLPASESISLTSIARVVGATSRR